MSVDRFLVGACRTGIGMSVVVTVGSPCGGLFFQAKEVRRKADQMVQLGKDVSSTPFPYCLTFCHLKTCHAMQHPLIYGAVCL
jgi:hypothetical protein